MTTDPIKEEDIQTNPTIEELLTLIAPILRKKRREYQRNWKLKNKERIREYTKKYRLKNQRIQKTTLHQQEDPK